MRGDSDARPLCRFRVRRASLESCHLLTLAQPSGRRLHVCAVCAHRSAYTHQDSASRLTVYHPLDTRFRTHGRLGHFSRRAQDGRMQDTPKQYETLWTDDGEPGVESGARG